MESPVYYERNLPHWLPGGSNLFVTFRLAGSLPAAALARLRAEFTLPSDAATPFDPTENYARQRRYFGCFDALLDRSTTGFFWLREPPIAQVVASALHYFDRKNYELIGYCIMPNHVHLVVSLSEAAPPLMRTLQQLKGYSALQANRLLGLSGQFWQRESYDHIVRGPEEMQRIIAYVVNNPVKAGLVADWQQWPYTYWAPP